MNFEYFNSLTPGEATAFLQEYLDTERRAVEELRAEAEREGVTADLSLGSIEPVFVWIADRLQALPREPDPNLPWWIRDAESYKNTLFDFDESSKMLDHARFVLLRRKLCAFVRDTFVGGRET